MPRGTRKKNAEDHITSGSSNMFADFGLPEATEKNAKVQLAVAINRIIEKKAIGTQAEIAQLLNATQPQVSELKNYKLSIFSLEKLVEFLLALDNDVEITIKPKVADGGAPRATVINKAA